MPKKELKQAIKHKSDICKKKVESTTAFDRVII